MKAIIVAGGRGERLKPLTDKIPKPMVEIDNQPVLSHIINLLKKNDIRDFIIALCYLPKVIAKFFGDGSKFGVNIIYTYENPQQPLGTAGAITLAKKFIQDTFIVTYADILRELDIEQMMAFHKKSKALATLNIYRRKSLNAKSMVLIDDQNRITKFIERPTPEDIKEDYIWINGSFYILEPQIYQFIPEDKKCDFGSDIFPRLLKLNKPLYAYPTTGYFIDIGNMKKLAYARKTFRIVNKA